MIEENSNIKNYAMFNDDKSHRYILSRIWNEKKPIPLFISKISGEADGIYLELTNNLITNNLYKSGYGGYYSANLCSGIHGKAKNDIDSETDKILMEYAKKSSEIIISWGTLTTNNLKEREIEVLKLIKSAKKKVLAVSDKKGRTNLHLLTPSIRKEIFLIEVNINDLLQKNTNLLKNANNKEDLK